MSIYEDREPLQLGGDLTPTVKWLVIANVVCFCVQHLLLSDEAQKWFMLVPEAAVQQFAVWQLVTYMFMHGDVWHLVFNMLMLWVLGRELEFYWGQREFLRFYFACGIGAALLNLPISFYYTQNPAVPMLGASGAIYGLLIAFGIIFWNRYITLLLGFFLPVTIKVKYLVIGLGLIALYSGLSRVADGVGHFAHLGGMAVGFVYMTFFKPSLRWGDSGRAHESVLGKWLRTRKENAQQQGWIRQRQQEAHFRDDLDSLLDKISEVGYENLSEDEKLQLKNASEALKQKNFQSRNRNE